MRLTSKPKVTRGVAGQVIVSVDTEYGRVTLVGSVYGAPVVQVTEMSQVFLDRVWTERLGPFEDDPAAFITAYLGWEL